LATEKTALPLPPATTLMFSFMSESSSPFAGSATAVS